MKRASENPAAEMLFAAIFLPQFPLQAVLRFREELRGQPVALVDEASSKGRILALTPAAEAAGIFRGMASPQALARCGTLLLLPRSAGEERSAGQILLEIAFSLSPAVEQTGEGICTVDLRGAKISRLEDWGEEVAGRFTELHLQARIGTAETPDLALLAARTASPVLVVRDSLAFLAARSLEELSPAPELLRILHDWGIRELGGLARLPKGEVAARLGAEAVRLWEMAAGKSRRLLRYVRTAEVFEEVFEFEHEVETAEPLLFLLRRFLEQLALRLRAAYRVAAQMHLILPLENGGAHARVFTIPAPTAEVEVLFRIVHTHLDGLHLEHRPIGLRLAIQATESKNQQLQIFENPLRDPNRFGETLGRLAALVGSENLGVPQPSSTHQPDRFRLGAPDFGAEEEPALLEEEPPDLSIGLPLRRYRPPHPAEVEMEHFRPVAVFSQAVRGRVAKALGPYRISGEWWDAAAWEVEEWDVELSAKGLYRICRKGRAWFIDGCYDMEQGGGVTGDAEEVRARNAKLARGQRRLTLKRAVRA